MANAYFIPALMKRAEAVALVIMLTASSPQFALAEVMDKEPTVAELWAWSGLYVGLALLLARRSPWLPCLVWPFSALNASVGLGELLDSAVGPAILAEAGWGYVVQAWATVAINGVSPLAIAAWSLRRR